MIAIEGQTILDLCIRQYGTLEALFVFASGNSLALDQELVPGQELEAAAFTAPADTLPAYEFVQPVVQNRTVTSDGQSLMDVAIQEAGNLEGLFELLAANNLTLESSLTAGATLMIPENQVQNKAMRDYFRSRGHRINTWTPEIITENELPDGVLWIDGDGAYIVDFDDSYLAVE